jgi:hypothetical protein
MLDESETDVRTMTVRLIDDAYCAWFTAETECETALLDWFHARGETRELTYLAYITALDHEEASARALQELWDGASASHEALRAKVEKVSD